ncbi:hypothetical protein NC653_024993 [Populus alba x Populus x berolinensis]|uniref:Uncharacterized protein n=1 Tax=Populus alba x Populus x berolinensis TaxID=444605 RepID=A0AAD6Q8I1_9ROSI|nr:hypothetical protein NC653_024993 [Populus alba x Populus x berolinensis]
MSESILLMSSDRRSADSAYWGCCFSADQKGFSTARADEMILWAPCVSDAIFHLPPAYEKCRNELKIAQNSVNLYPFTSWKKMELLANSNFTTK